MVYAAKVAWYTLPRSRGICCQGTKIGPHPECFQLKVSRFLNISLCVVRVRSSVRQIAVYNPKDLSRQLAKVDIDTSPAILVPFYDEGSSTIFLTGRVSGLMVSFDTLISTLSHFDFDISRSLSKDICEAFYEALYISNYIAREKLFSLC